MGLVLAARFYNGFEAGIAQSRLTDEGIESHIFDLEMNWSGAPVRLMVAEEDLEAARALLADPSAGSELDSRT